MRLREGISKYIQIATELRAAIESGELAPNDRLPSYAEMTERFGVAKHTVDRAHSLLQQEGLIRREERRGIYVEPRSVRRTGNIGLLLRGITGTEASARQLISGVQRQARSAGLNIILVDEFGPLPYHQIDGLLISSSNLEVLLLELPPTLPRVLLMVPAAPVAVANVVANDFEGARMATQHLLELGHRRISYMPANDHDSYTVQRMAGYQAALQEAGISFEAELCLAINISTDFLMENVLLDTERAMKEWLDQGWRNLNSTAILAPNDFGALVIMKVLREAGLRVPEDVSVVGFDGIGLDARNEAFLTTVVVPFAEVGAEGVCLLQAQIGQGGPSWDKVQVPVRLRVGKSTLAIA